MSTISLHLQASGDRWIITMTALNRETKTVEFKTEKEARSALTSALVRAREMESEGRIKKIEVNREP